MAATPPLRDRLSFLHRLPILLKGTSDDEAPCPGYLFEEIASISHESLGSSQCLLEYLLRRLQSSSGHVKLKVLKILLYLCNHGSSSFLLILKRNSAFIQEATVFAGPPDPLHGTSLYQKVRLAAQDLGGALFSDAVSPLPSPQTPRPLPPVGMGSQPQPHSALQGFGYSQQRGRVGSAGEVLLSTIQKATEAVANAVLPALERRGSLRATPGGSTYQPAVTPSTSQLPPGRPFPGISPTTRAVRHQPGQPGGGWEEPDSSSSSQGSSQNGGQSRVSDSGSGGVSDGRSGASREPGELAERVEAVALNDWQQETSLVRAVSRGPRAFLSREEAQHFLKECGRLNCEAVLELLIRQLDRTQECEQMRTLCALSTLGGSDLLSQEHVLQLARPRLQELSVGSPGPVTSKATKLLRHLEASCRQRSPTWRLPVEPGPTVPEDTRACPPDLLTDTAPLPGGQLSLPPLSPALLLPGPAPTPAPGDTRVGPESVREAEVTLAILRGPGAGSATLDGGPEALAVGSSKSLFAGMELVTREPLLPHSPSEAPQMLLSSRAAAQVPPASELSAFPFLNE
ncbi:PREDICTED: AP-4 complex accessory subunit tepsin [Chrysochloris asiatica]|uniref:AP-4 complex accessory subunit Tepsin n=1 Tax=Chrysochloris asiatica TaxID=185453 RepID=A0A9B0WWK8_CHRAS|nr:PREDICTED: AP-4 complex accessory subunit tepsin [Chrysochloris asiatica]